MDKQNIPASKLPSKPCNFFIKLKAFFKSKPMRIIWKIVLFVLVVFVSILGATNKSNSRSSSYDDNYDDTNDNSNGELRHGHSGFGYYHDDGVKR